MIPNGKLCSLVRNERVASIIFKEKEHKINAIKVFSAHTASPSTPKLLKC